MKVLPFILYPPEKKLMLHIQNRITLSNITYIKETAIDMATSSHVGQNLQYRPDVLLVF